MAFVKSVKLNNGYEMPILGLGTWGLNSRYNVSVYRYWDLSIANELQQIILYGHPHHPFENDEY
uniref:NADP-dependent oxidoreductase domain-containing protein n=1 Tax=Glossina austeni TaxID=7395 RepID=A0A1A9URY0_GLOAU